MNLSSTAHKRIPDKKRKSREIQIYDLTTFLPFSHREICKIFSPIGINLHLWPNLDISSNNSLQSFLAKKPRAVFHQQLCEKSQE